MVLTFDTRLADRARTHWRAVGRIVPAVTLSIALSGAPVGAQGSARRALVHADSARHVADLFFRAVADERWDVAAGLTDTMVVQRMVRDRLRWRRQEPAPPEMTIEDFMRDDPNKPRVVAEYEFKRYRERAAQFAGDPITYEFARVKSVDELARLSAREATARYIEAQDVRASVREMARRAGCADSAFGGGYALHRILAAALANDTVAFVLHTAGFLDDGFGPGMEPMVMELRLRDTSWRIRPGYGLLRRTNTAVGWVGCDSTRRRRPGG